VSQIIHSNAREIIDQHQYLFDTLWNKAIPAEQRAREIEENKPADRSYSITASTSFLATLAPCFTLISFRLPSL